MVALSCSLLFAGVGLGCEQAELSRSFSNADSCELSGEDLFAHDTRGPYDAFETIKETLSVADGQISGEVALPKSLFAERNAYVRILGGETSHHVPRGQWCYDSDSNSIVLHEVECRSQTKQSCEQDSECGVDEQGAQGRCDSLSEFKTCSYPCEPSAAEVEVMVSYYSAPEDCSLAGDQDGDENTSNLEAFPWPVDDDCFDPDCAVGPTCASRVVTMTLEPEQGSAGLEVGYGTDGQLVLTYDFSDVPASAALATLHFDLDMSSSQKPVVSLEYEPPGEFTFDPGWWPELPVERDPTTSLQDPSWLLSDTHLEGLAGVHASGKWTFMLTSSNDRPVQINQARITIGYILPLD